ncbi:MAG: ABC transporter substrate-binding protein [Magnetococcales bacterium]|nr:ABC transporter substrate-binding protein [Magnetococcales bacterium]
MLNRPTTSPLPHFLLILLLTLTGCGESPQPPAEELGKESWRAEVAVPPPSQPKAPPGELDRALMIGVVGPLTGEGAEFGQQVRDGLMTAAHAFNDAGGIDGQPIGVIIGDNEGDSELTRGIVQGFLQKNVLAIFAAPTGWSTFAATQIVNRSETLFIAVGPRRRISRSGPYIFRLALADEIAIAALTKMAVSQMGLKRFALVTSSLYEHSLTTSALFKQALPVEGGEIVVEGDTYDTYTGQSGPDKVVPTLLKVDPPVDGILFTGGDEEGATLAQALQKAGIKAPLLGNEDLFTDQFLQAGGEAVVGSRLYSTWHPKSDTPHMGRFQTGFSQVSKLGVPERFAALAYDGFMLLAEAIQKARSTKPSQVREVLVNPEGFPGATGQTAFAEDGEAIKEPVLMEVQSLNGQIQFVPLPPES